MVATIDEDEITRAVFFTSSEKALPVLLTLLAGQPSTLFWPCFLKLWNACEVTFPWRVRLLQTLRMRAAEDNPQRYWSAEDKQLFDMLPPLVPVYRGCNRPAVRRVAWTLDRAVAVGFAEGHRGLEHPDPVIAAAMIPKAYIFALITDRQESEVVLDPRRLRKLVVTAHSSTLSSI